MGFIHLEEQETEIELKLAKKFSDQDITDIDIKDFYPEFNFKEIYGAHSPSIPISKYFIPFDQIIVKIAPLSSKREFRASYNIEFDEVIELTKIGKILPIICFSYEKFPQFYDELFKLGPFPRTGRVRVFLAEKTNTDSTEIKQQIEENSSNELFKNLESYFKDYNGNKKQLFLDSFSSDLFDLKILGLDEIYEIVFDLMKEDPSFAHQTAFDFTNLLVRPLFDGLQGINTFSEYDINKAKSLYLKAHKIKTKCIKGETNKDLLNSIENFLGLNPAELIRFIDRDLKLTFPTSAKNNVKYVEGLEKDTTIQEFRKVLSGIKTSEFNKKSFDDLSKVSSEVSKLLKKDSKRLNILSKWVNDLLFLGAIVPGAAGQVLFDTTLANLFYGTVYASFMGTRYDSLKKFSMNAAGSIFKKLTQKPLATTYWKQNIEG